MPILKSYGGATVGDVVTLKSGGPDMTIGSFDQPYLDPNAVSATGAVVDNPPTVRCHYIMENGAPMSVDFPFYTLDIKQANKPSRDPGETVAPLTPGTAGSEPLVKETTI